MRNGRRKVRNKRKRKLKNSDKKIIESIRRTKQMLGIPCSAKDKRGFEAENKVFKVLEKFKERKKKFPGRRIIASFRRTMHYSLQDRKGKDFIVNFWENGKFNDEKIEELGIQVQNWSRPGLKERFERKGLCFIFVHPRKKNLQESVYYTMIFHLYLKVNCL